MIQWVNLKRTFMFCGSVCEGHLGLRNSDQWVSL